MACACTELAGEEVAVTVIEEWLQEFLLSDREERWATMVPRLKVLLDRLIAEEADRRVKGYDPERNANPDPIDG